MSGDLRKSVSFLRPKLGGSKGFQCYDDKLAQIRIERTDYLDLDLFSNKMAINQQLLSQYKL